MICSGRLILCIIVFVGYSVSSTVGSGRLRGVVRTTDDVDYLTVEREDEGSALIATTKSQDKTHDDVLIFGEEVISLFDDDWLVFEDEDEDDEFIVRCANESGTNPCGPGRACHQTDSGFTCEDIPEIQGCPAGCAPHSTCVFQHDDQNYSCECDTGYYRFHPNLGCVAVDETSKE